MNIADNATAYFRSRRGVFGTTRCTFSGSSRSSSFDGTTEQAGILDLLPWVNQTPMTLSVGSAQEIVVQFFQRMVGTPDSHCSSCLTYSQGLRYLLLTQKGRLVGLLTKTDIYERLREEGISSAKADLLRHRHGDSSTPLRTSAEASEEQWGDSADTNALLAEDVR